jgi:4-amino-4-deoxy-L-arabinose transferase-like glycosyltransferase
VSRRGSAAAFFGALENPWIAIPSIAATMLATAGAFGLLEPTETRYAEIAREMRVTGDFLTPYLLGIPHFHKPSISYWTIAAGFAAFGENEWGARIPMTLAAIGTLVLTVVAARRRFAALEIPAGLAMWTLGASVYFLGIGRAVASDPLLAVSVAGFWAFAPGIGALLALGLGFAVKGPVVFVHTVLPILVVAAWCRDRRALSLLGPARGWIAFAAVALPWYVIVIARTPGLLGYLLHNQLWQRYTTHLHQRGGPAWYFAAVLLAGSLPWTPALIAGLRAVWRTRERIEARLLLAWLVAPIAFLSFSGSKLPAYLLPCFPAAASIAAIGLREGGRAVAWSVTALLVVLAAAGAWLGPGALAKALGAEAASVSLPAGAMVALVCLVYASTWMARSRPATAGLLIVLAYAAAVAALARYEGPLGSPRPMARMLAELRGAGEPVVELGQFNAGLPFYLGAPVSLLEVPRETIFEPRGMHKDPRITRDSLASMTERTGRVWILGPQHDSEALAAALRLRYQRVVRWRKDALGTLSR